VNVIPSSRQQNSAQYSPDGRHIAFESKRGGGWALWVSDLDGGNLLNVSKDIFGSGGPRWSPDGNKVAFDTAAVNPSSIYIVDIAEGLPRKLETNVGRRGRTMGSGFISRRTSDWATGSTDAARKAAVPNSFRRMFTRRDLKNPPTENISTSRRVKSIFNSKSYR
jgi:Tol biopolymer transport system component